MIPEYYHQWRDVDIRKEYSIFDIHKVVLDAKDLSQRILYSLPYISIEDVGESLLYDQALLQIAQTLDIFRSSYGVKQSLIGLIKNDGFEQYNDFPEKFSKTLDDGWDVDLHEGNFSLTVSYPRCRTKRARLSYFPSYKSNIRLAIQHYSDDRLVINPDVYMTIVTKSGYFSQVKNISTEREKDQFLKIIGLEGERDL